MSETLLDQAHALCAALNNAGNRHAARYARLPYSVARLDDDPYIKRIERLLTRAWARYNRRAAQFVQHRPARIVITPDTQISVPDWHCPYCNERTLYLEFDEWDAETGAPTDTGTHVHCRNELPSDHCDMPYVYWLPVQQRAARWAAQHVAIMTRDERRELAAWIAGEPIRGVVLNIQHPSMLKLRRLYDHPTLRTTTASPDDGDDPDHAV